MRAGLVVQSIRPRLFFLLACFSVFFYANAFADTRTSSYAVSDMGSVRLLLDAEKIISQSSLPPVFNHAETIVLPDYWQHEKQGFHGSVWYKIPFFVEQKIKQQWAIYLPEVNMNAEVWLNETYLGSGGNMQSPVSRYWHSPLRFVFSPSDIRLENYFYIRVVAYANEFGRLGSVHVGERNIIEQLYSENIFSAVTVHVISGVLAAAYALFMALVWWKRRDPVFFWGALVCGVWSISSMNMYVVNAPMPVLHWEKIMQISMGWIPLLFFFFMLRLDEVKAHKIFDKTILWLAALSTVAIILSPESSLFFLSRVWHLCTMVFGIAGVLRIFYSWFKYRKKTQLAMVIAFCFIAICGVHDVFVQNQIIQSGEIFWLDYSVPLILLLIGFLMVSRFLMAVQTSERLNAELESRVQQAHEKIGADYNRIIDLENERASNKERERIYRDMHDDMGAKLLSLVYKADSDEMSHLARSAMNDLRAIVSKKPGEKHTLNSIIDKWRQTCKKRCSEAGYKIHWQQSVIPDSVMVSAEAEQHIQRVQTEAITNAIKYSTGNLITIRVFYRFNGLYSCVANDADYTKLGQWREGRGLSNMHFRIKQLNGKIRWQAEGGGGCDRGKVSWFLPIEKNQT